ncbi:MAG: type III-B CRISPR-associated protein Cas10/Cmr2, partial [Thermodesulfobacteriota bacterium]|nr:type III-B CRISPR-associated protein Cas10/Cmr2 [Thermodesulfobacteriota bacterium]
MLTHPTGDEKALLLELTTQTFDSQLVSEVVKIVHEDFDEQPGGKGLSDKFKGDPVGFSSARFHYIHHVLRERLAQEDIGGLGGAWYRIPADTRIPDHSIWHHCALVSALSSCFELSRENRASLFVFNITPVQGFIGQARKLRDFWTGSLILSWLAFEGIRQVIYTLGSDHLLYPSVIGQPMVNELLSKESGLTWLASQTESSSFRDVASFPNKFVCLVPTGNEQQMAEDIKKAINNAWSDLGEKTLELIENVIKKSDPNLKEQFQRQIPSFWEFHWSACPLLDETSRDSVQSLLHKEVWKNPFDFVDTSKGISFEGKGEGAFYGVTHALAQSVLAVGKTRRRDQRQTEPGIKCSLHGDFEALRLSWEEGADQNPRPAKDPFWSKFKGTWETKSDFKPSERLSAIAMVKRLASYVCKKISDHPLKPFFEEAASFPSTTEMALSDWLARVEKNGLTGGQKNWRQKLAQYIHEGETERKEKEEGSEVTELTHEDRAYSQDVKKKMEEMNDPVTDEDKYYAILLMDGDHMGRLVNGETLSSRWETTIHPDLVDRFADHSFDKSYRDFWLANLNKTRILSPAVHAAISESLGDFSLYTVPAIVERHKGRLIYAGGDDVCAIFPVSTVVQAAREIAEKYSVGFLFFSWDKKKQTVPVKKA